MKIYQIRKGGKTYYELYDKMSCARMRWFKIIITTLTVLAVTLMFISPLSSGQILPQKRCNIELPDIHNQKFCQSYGKQGFYYYNKSMEIRLK